MQELHIQGLRISQRHQELCIIPESLDLYLSADENGVLRACRLLRGRIAVYLGNMVVRSPAIGISRLTAHLEAKYTFSYSR